MLNNYEFVFKSVYSVFYGHVLQDDTFFLYFSEAEPAVDFQYFISLVGLPTN